MDGIAGPVEEEEEEGGGGGGGGGGFSSLPRDLLVRIFSHLTEKEIVSKAAPVCGHWFRASRHPSLWAALEFHGERTPVNDILRKLRATPELRSVTLVAVPAVAVVIRQLCRRNKELRSAAFRYCTRREDEVLSEVVLRNLLTSCPRLVRLDLQGTQFRVGRLFQALTCLSRMTGLNLAMNRHLRVDDLLTLAISCPRLQELRVGPAPAPMSDHHAAFMLGQLEGSLRVLRLDMGGLGAPAYQAVLRCGGLTELSLRNALQFPADQFRSLPRHLPRLRQLAVRNASRLQCADFCHVFATCEETPPPHLSALDLGGCWGLGDACAAAIALACGDSLLHLSLKCCKGLTGAGIEHVLSRCRRLRSFSAAHAGGQAALSAHAIAYAAPQLRLLVLHPGQLRDHEAAVATLKADLPSLRLLESLSEYSRKDRPL